MIKRPCASVEGKLEAQNTWDHHVSEVRVQDFASMDQGNREEQARVRLIDYEGKGKVDRL